MVVGAEQFWWLAIGEGAKEFVSGGAGAGGGVVVVRGVLALGETWIVEEGGGEGKGSGELAAQSSQGGDARAEWEGVVERAGGAQDLSAVALARAAARRD